MSFGELSVMRSDIFCSVEIIGHWNCVQLCEHIHFRKDHEYNSTQISEKLSIQYFFFSREQNLQVIVCICHLLRA